MNTSSPTPRKATAVGKTSNVACIRCRQKKKRCDQKLPNCRLCELAGVPCFAYDPATKRQVPRSYVNDLEQRVALLEKELQKQRQTARGDDGTKPQSEEQLSWLSERPEGHRQDLPPHMHNPAAEAQRTLERISAAMRPAAASREFELSKTLLRCLLVNKSPASATGVPSLERHGQTAAGLVNDLGSDMVSLPSRDRANHLIDAYFQFANLCMPLLHEGSFQARVSMLYEMPHTIDFNNVHTTTETRLALFFLFEIFGIATLLMQKQDLLRVPTWLADRYHNVAMAALSEAGLPGGVLGVQVLTLMAQYSYHHAVLQDAWCIVGWALRLAVEVGLHRDPPPAESPDSLSLDTMRRTFWVAYSMDRNLSRSNLQPLFLPDGAITAKFPSVMQDRYITADGISSSESNISALKLVSLHLLRYRLVQSEIHTVLYQPLSVPLAITDMGLWRVKMHAALDNWYQSVPSSKSPNTLEKTFIETFEVTYNTGVVQFCQPTRNNPTPSSESLLRGAQAAKRVIQLYRKFFNEHKLTIYWQAVESLRSAGTLLLYGYAHSSEVRDRIAFPDLQSIIQTCSSVLWAMVEHYPTAKATRDAFDIMATDILADISRSILSRDADSHTSIPDDGNDDSSSTPSCTQLPQSSLVLSRKTSAALSPNVEDSTGLPSPESTELVPGSNDGSSDFPFLYDDFDSMSMIWEAMTSFDDGFAPAWI